MGDLHRRAAPAFMAASITFTTLLTGASASTANAVAIDPDSGTLLAGNSSSTPVLVPATTGADSTTSTAGSTTAGSATPGSATADRTTAGSTTATETTTAAATATLVGAGDIASCSGTADSKTAATAATVPGIVFTLGDNVYPDGSLSNYRNCYAPSWGTLKSRTRPVPGNHDYYKNPGAKGYFSYFGSNAGSSNRGYYAYNAGSWRVYALNSELAPSGAAYTTEYNWLKSDLATNPAKCVLAMWHRPAFSTGPHGNSARMGKFFQLLYDNGADVVLNGHDHMYERYMPVDANGNPDPLNGIREFVVGTGGESHYGYKTTSPTVEVRDNTTYGVLRLDLSAGGYAWQFLRSAGGAFADSGTGTCH